MRLKRFLVDIESKYAPIHTFKKWVYLGRIRAIFYANKFFQILVVYTAPLRKEIVKYTEISREYLLRYLNVAWKFTKHYTKVGQKFIQKYSGICVRETLRYWNLTKIKVANLIVEWCEKYPWFRALVRFIFIVCVKVNKFWNLRIKPQIIKYHKKLILPVWHKIEPYISKYITPHVLKVWHFFKKHISKVDIKKLKRQIAAFAFALGAEIKFAFGTPEGRRRTIPFTGGMLVILLPLLILLYRLNNVKADWFDDRWAYRRAITINYSGSTTLIDYQVKVSGIPTLSLYTSGKINWDCSDIRFTDINGRLLSHWLEDPDSTSDNNNNCSTGNRNIWVKVPSLQNGSTTLYMYYGNVNATNYSNGRDVFDFFEDFSSSPLEVTKWSNTGPANISGGNIALNSTLNGITSRGAFCSLTATNNDTCRLGFSASESSTALNLAHIGFSSAPISVGYTASDSAYFYFDATTGGNFETGSSRLGTTEPSSVAATEDTAFNNYQIKVTSSPSNAVFTVNSTSVTHSTRVPAALMYVRAQSTDATNTLYLDYIFVGKVAVTDPGTPSIGSEQSAFRPLAYFKFDEASGNVAHNEYVRELGADPVFYLSMDDGTLLSHSCSKGGSVTGVCDESGGNNHAAASSAMNTGNFSFGRVGQYSLRFDGVMKGLYNTAPYVGTSLTSPDSLTVTDNSALDLTNNLTLQAWVNGDNGPWNNSRQTIAGKWTSSTTGFTSLSNWSAIDVGLSTINGVSSPKSYTGGIYDGRYIYYAPYDDGNILRYDTAGSFTSLSSWSALDIGLSTVNSVTTLKGYVGGVYDGRYVYFVPFHDGSAYHGRMLKYDTTGEFTNLSSWSAIDIGAQTINGVSTLKGYLGGVYDGRYIYYVPYYEGAANHGRMLKYDTAGEFTNTGSWSAIDMGSVTIDGVSTFKGYVGGVLVGKYIYYIPNNTGAAYNGKMLRYDTTGTFTNLSSWNAVDIGLVTIDGVSALKGYLGGVSDGRYVYYVPIHDGSNYHGKMVRYDTTGAFSSTNSWDAIDIGLSTVNGVSNLKGYYGGIFDGKYVYYAPYYNGSINHGEMLRYDTSGSFTSLSSWNAIDVGLSTINGVSSPRGYLGGIYDGRYIYYAPYTDGTPIGKMLRYDTLGGDTGGSYSLEYSLSSNPFGGEPGGLTFKVAVAGGLRAVNYNGDIHGAWHHVAGTYDGATISIFVDGASVATRIYSSTSPALVSTTDLTIANTKNSQTYFTGELDDVKLYNYVRSTSQFSVSSRSNPSGSVLYLPLDDTVSGNGQTIKDLSGFSNNGITSDVGGSGMICAIDGYVSKACDFDSVDDFISIPNSSSLNITSSMAVSAWVNGDDSPWNNARQTIAGKWTSASNPSFTNISNWGAFDLSGLTINGVANLKGYVGEVYDGRYIYYVPYYDNSVSHGRMVRYDTTGTFTSASSWSAVDIGLSTVNGVATPKGFNGGVYDGRYVYYVPWNDSGASGKMLRYDTTGTFTSLSSWSAVDIGLSTIDGVIHPQAYEGGVYDGRYVYYVNGDSGKMVRYDTTGTFTSLSSWSAVDVGLSTINGVANSKGYYGGVYDGRYIYYVPRYDGSAVHGKMLRYDTTGTFTNLSSWSAVDIGLSTINGVTNPKGYYGGVYDGRYIYYVPYNDGSYHGKMVRYDTTGTFTSLSSWSAVDIGLSTINGASPLKGYVGGVYDGRYIYYVPFYDGAAYSGKMTRYDTTETFTSLSSWSVVDVGLSTVNGVATPNCYMGGGYDGRYVYYVPWHDGSSGKMLRYDTLGGNINGSYSLEYSLSSNSFGAEPGGLTFKVAVAGGLRTVNYNGDIHGAWHNVIGIYDGTTISMLVDGSSVANQTYSTAANIISSTTPVTIANIYSGKTNYDGKLDEIYIFNTSSSIGSDSSVSGLLNFNYTTNGYLNANNLGGASGVMMHMSMDDNVSGNGQTVRDLTLNGNNGTTVDVGGTAVACNVTGKVGSYACEFAGMEAGATAVGDYINIPYKTSLDATTSVSVSAWVNGDDAPWNNSRQTIAGKWTSSTSGFTSTSNWSAVDIGLSTINGVSNLKGYVGGVYDGRYVYYVNYAEAGATYSGKMLRYDTTGTFTSTNSWGAVDVGLSTINGVSNLKGYVGGVYDGRYLYYAPFHDVTVYHGKMLRYDTTGAFTSTNSWSAVDIGLSTINGVSNLKGFNGGVYDGRYLYYVPYNDGSAVHGKMLRYDTTGTFTNTSSWSAVNIGLSTINGVSNLKGYYGGVYDGRYVYYVPYNDGAASSGKMLRYDTTGTFTNISSWSAVDIGLSTINGVSNLKGYIGGVYDGRYIYYVNYYDGSFSGKMLRYDTTGTFTNLSSWSAVNIGLSTISGVSSPRGYQGGMYDGRYIYYVPSGDEAVHGKMLRYDTSGTFTNLSSWSVLNVGLSTINGVSSPRGYEGGVYDGRYIYYVPFNDGAFSGKMLRYDTLGGDTNGSYSLEYSLNSNSFGAEPGGLTFKVAVAGGLRTVNYNGDIHGAWHHVAGTYDGDTISLLVDGSSVASQTYSTTANILSSSTPATVANTYSGQTYYDGKLDDVRFYNYARNGDQLTAEVQNASSSNSFNYLNENSSENAIWSIQGIGGGSLLYDGSNDNVIINNVNMPEIFSTSLWFRKTGGFNTGLTSVQYLLSNFDNGGYKLYMKNTGVICAGIDDDSTWTPDDELCTTKIYNDSKWHNVIFEKNGFSSIKIYVDGYDEGADYTLNSSGLLFATQKNTYVGINADRESSAWQGQIDELKVYASVLTKAQRLSEFNRGAGVLIGKQGEIDSYDISNGLLLHLSMDTPAAGSAPAIHLPLESNVSGNGQSLPDVSGNSNNGTTVDVGGTAVACNVTGKIGSYACEFAGMEAGATASGDSINVSDSTSLDITNNLTIEGWINGDDSPWNNSRQTIAGKWTPSTSGFTSISNWSALNIELATVNGVTNFKGYTGGVYDGRYIYYVAGYDGTTPYHGRMLRYDTTSAFNVLSSWSAIDVGLSTINGVSSPKGYNGGVYDGRYIYFVPYLDNGVAYSGKMLRYDTTGTFTGLSSWSAIDVGLSTVNGVSNLKGYSGGVYDGRYVYYVPNYDGVTYSGKMLRYDTTGTFTNTSSWNAIEIGLSTINGVSGPIGYNGGVFDGRYIYYIPSYNGAFHGKMLRYDTTGTFTSTSSWDAVNVGLSTINGVSSPKGYIGGVYDGRYIYYVPYDNGSSGKMLRYDTIGTFSNLNSWSAVDIGLSTINGVANPVGYYGGVYDGRYIYYVPYAQGASGKMLRYDTTGTFTSASSWGAVNVGLSTIDGVATLQGYQGGVYDGRYIYYVPYNYGSISGKMLRYDTLGGSTNGSYSLEYSLNSNSYGAEPGGLTFKIAVAGGIRSVHYNGDIHGAWHHVAGTYDGDTISLLVDGTQVATQSYSSTAPALVSTTDLNLANTKSSQTYFDGKLDNFKIYPDIRSSNQLYWDSKNQTKDDSGNNFHGNTLNYAYTTNGTNKFGDVMSFNGVGGGLGYVNVGTTFQSVKTVSFWVYPNSNTEYLMNFSDSPATYIRTAVATLLTTGFDTTKTKRYVDGAQVTDATGAMTANSWHHVVITTENGITADKLQIGRVGSNYLTGKVDDVRLYSTLWDSDTVKSFYQHGDKELLYLDFNEGSGYTLNDRSGNANNATTYTVATSPSTLVPTTLTWSGAGKYGSTIDFTGSNQYAVVPNSDSLNPTASVAVSAWVKGDDALWSNTRETIAGKWASAGDSSFTNIANWSALNVGLSVINGVPSPKSYVGGVYDGRYIYYVANYDGVARHGKMLRYDTTGTFMSLSNWSAIDVGLSTINGLSSLGGYAGGVYDGRYIYYVPQYDSTGYDGRMLRYDTTGTFTSLSSWNAVNIGLSTINGVSILRGFTGGVFDGRYVYYVPNNDGPTGYVGKMLRYDTTGIFSSLSSWGAIDVGISIINGVSSPKGFVGGVYDGRYVYYVPYVAAGKMVRYDTTGTFTSISSWGAIDVGLSTINGVSSPAGYMGGVYDGRYMYYVPYNDGKMVRYDTTGTFTSLSSWSAVDVGLSTINGVSTLKGYTGGVYDGRYVYYSPQYDGTAFHGKMLRYDTTGTFTSASSWSAVDIGLSTINGISTLKGYSGGVYDGRYIYYAPYYDSSASPYHGKMLRYDTLGGDTNGSYSLEYSLNSNSFGAEPGGLTFKVAVAGGLRTVTYNKDISGDWHNVVGAYDGTTVSLYVDNTQVASQTYGSDVPVLVTTTDLGVANTKNAQTYFDGKIDELKIYDYAPTATDVLEEYVVNRALAPVLWFKFDEGYSTITKDAVLGVGATVTGATWSFTGKYGKSLQFVQGTTNNVLYPNSATGNFNGNSVSVWFKHSATSPSGLQYLLDSHVSKGFKLWMGTDGKINFGIDDDSSWGPDVTVTTTKAYNDDTWHQIVAVRSIDSDNKIYIYIDGASASGKVDASSVGSISNTGAIYMGNNSSTNGSWDGQLDEIRLFNYPLSNGEVRMEYNRYSTLQIGKNIQDMRNDPATSAASCDSSDTGLEACWRFDENTGTTINDSSTNGNTGTVFGSINWVTLGKFGSAIDFVGSTSAITVPDSSSLDVSPSMTIEGWVNGDDKPWNNKRQTIVGKWTSSASGFTSSSNWSAVDIGLSTIDGLSNLKGYQGGIYDGRYIYYVPFHDGSGYSGKMLRYDTTGAFASASSWNALDVGPVSINGVTGFRGYQGGVFDGRYVYYAPVRDGLPIHGKMLRHDTTGTFTSTSSWSAIDVGLLTIDGVSNLQGYGGGLYDGRYIYYAPAYNGVGISYHGKMLRYDTTGTFTSSSSWNAIDLSAATIDGVNSLRGHQGAVYDGKYIYYVPFFDGYSYSGRMVRYDTTGTFTSTGSWNAVNIGLSTVDGVSNLRGYVGGVYDGRYIYYVPHFDGSVYHGRMLRYDTTGTFTNIGSWSAVDIGLSTINGVSNLKGYGGGIYDGRYIYYVPWYDGSANSGKMLRYDTTGTFTSLSSWSAVDIGLSTINGVSTLKGYVGGVYDGRYINYVPYSSGNGKMLRYDTLGGDTNGSYSLEYNLNSNSFGAEPGGLTFKVAVAGGIRSTHYNGNISGAWHNVVGSYDGTTINLYVDNTQVATQVYSSTAPALITTTDVTIADTKDSKTYFNGKLDDVRIYSYVHDNPNIAQVGVGPITYWKFDENTGTTVNDSSTHNQTGTVSGSINWRGFGKFGNAIEFVGSTSAINVPDSALLDVSPSITVEGWVNGDDALWNNARQTIAGKWTPSTSGFTSTSNWSAVNIGLSTIDGVATPKGYVGGVYDGRYIYYVPYYEGTVSGKMLRYDTAGTFTSTSSWDAVDIGLSTINGVSTLKGYQGGVYDGRYIYYVPYSDGAASSGKMLRYDTTGTFTSLSSWSAVNIGLSTIDGVSSPRGYLGGVYDGRYIYYVPYNDGAYIGKMLRYDTTGTFTNISSWSAINVGLSTISGVSSPVGYWGGVYDGRYVYYVPSEVSGKMLRYDTTATFTSLSSWSAVDIGLSTIDGVATPKGYGGGVYDGRYIYYVPYWDGAARNGKMLRYDTTGVFTNTSSWDAIDIGAATINGVSTLRGYIGGVYDGRYVYYVNHYDAVSGSGYSGKMLRYDTTGAFTSTGNWSAIDMGTATINGVSTFKGCFGGVYDGRYIYYVPYYDGSGYNGKMLRYDTLGGDTNGSYSLEYSLNSNSFGAEPGGLTFKVAVAGGLRTVNYNGDIHGAWHHVAGTYDGITISLLVDGKQVSTQAYNSNASALITTTDLNIANTKDSQTYFDGKLDDMRIYDYVRNSRQVFQDMFGDHNAVHAIAHWALDEGQGSIIRSKDMDSVKLYNSLLEGTLAGGSAPSWLSVGSTAVDLDPSGVCAKSRCLSFTSSEHDFVSFGGTQPASDVYAVSLWVYPSSTSQPFIQLGSGISIGVSGGTVATNGLGTPAVYVNGEKSSTLQANTWSHIVVVAGTPASKNALSVKLGTDGSTYLDGRLDEISLYNYALIPSEVKELYNMGAVYYK